MNDYRPRFLLNGRVGESEVRTKAYRLQRELQTGTTCFLIWESQSTSAVGSVIHEILAGTASRTSNSGSRAILKRTTESKVDCFLVKYPERQCLFQAIVTAPLRMPELRMLILPGTYQVVDLGSHLTWRMNISSD